MIFSRSAVVDSQNTSGFGKKGGALLVAIYIRCAANFNGMTRRASGGLDALREVACGAGSVQLPRGRHPPRTLSMSDLAILRSLTTQAIATPMNCA